MLQSGSFPKAAYACLVTHYPCNCQLIPYLQFKGSCCVAHCCIAVLQYPGLLCATGWGSLCPLDKPHICGSACGNPPASCGNPRGKNFFGNK